MDIFKLQIFISKPGINNHIDEAILGKNALKHNSSARITKIKRSPPVIFVHVSVMGREVEFKFPKKNI